jgi:hypothetical protein
VITNRMTGEWLRLMADVEHEPEYDALEQTITIEVVPGILRPQALDLPREIRNGLVREFADSQECIHV